MEGECRAGLMGYTRDCSQDLNELITGSTTGKYPAWLSGTLLRNGPGTTRVGDDQFKHIFDCPSLLHRFVLEDGEAKYQCKFQRSRTYSKNLAAQRIVVSEFATVACPDPCQSIFQRFSSLFTEKEASDNCVVSIYPFDDEVFALGEYPEMLRIDPASLDTLSTVNVDKGFGIVFHTSHPHVEKNGHVYNIGLAIETAGPKYTIISFPNTVRESRQDNIGATTGATKAGAVSTRWRWHPGYMHSFGITPNYFVVIEQPLSISVATLYYYKLTGGSPASALEWFPDAETLIHVVSRETGEVVKTFPCQTFFFFHIINQYEDNDSIVIDVCIYKDASILDAAYIDAIKGEDKGPEHLKLLNASPARFKLPLGLTPEKPIAPELLADCSCEMPRVNYPDYLGRPYRYFYAISGQTSNTPKLVKVDTVEGIVESWESEGWEPSEPVFIPSPNSTLEDDGILLASLISLSNSNTVALVAVDARTMKELARTVFDTPSPVPNTFHGWFFPQ